MADYKSIIGKPLKLVSTNLDNDQAEGQIWYNSTLGQFKDVIVRSAWASAPNLVSGRNQTAAAGTQDASILFGGKEGPPPNADTGTTQEYNGSGWAFGGTMTDARYELGGAGTQTAGLAFGGIDGGSNTTATEAYNGTSWTNGGALTQATYEQAGAGTQTAALAFGGQRQPGIIESNTQKYDGSSWTNTGALNSARRFAFGFGIQTAAVAAGGTPPSPASSATEEFDGSSWTTVNSMNSGRRVGGSSGILTAGLAYGGADANPSNKTEQYNGTTWSVESTLGTARYNHYGAGTNDTGAIYAAGGPPSGLSIAEEYTKSVNIITAGAWASDAAINTARLTKNGGLGPTSASLIFCGNPGTAPYTTNATEEYNGFSWINTGNYPASNSEVSGAAGTQTAALGFGQSDSPTSVVANYDGSSWTVNPASFPASSGGCGTGEVNSAIYCGQTSTNSLVWNGSSWTAGGTMNTARSGQGSGFGNESSAIHATGRTSPSTLTNDSEEYNGSSWTSVGNVNTARKRLAASRAFSNASGYIFGGTPATSNAGPTFTDTEFWNGTSWATHPNLGTATGNQFGAGTTDAFSIGGQPNPPVTTATEIFTPETTALNIKTVSTS